MAIRKGMLSVSAAGIYLMLAVATGIAAGASTAPSDLTLTPSGDIFTLSWTKATDESYNQAHTIHWWETGKPDDYGRAVVRDGLSSTEWKNDHLTAGQTYHFQVFSVKTDEDGLPVVDDDEEYIPGGNTNTVAYKIPFQPHPTDLTITQNSPVILTWEPGNDPRIDYQNVKRRERGSVEWATIRVGKDVGTYTDPAAKIGKKYIYRIESWNDKPKKIGLSRPASVRVR